MSAFYPNIAGGATSCFDSVEAFQQACAPHADAIVGDNPNDTNTQPTIQLSEVNR